MTPSPSLRGIFLFGVRAAGEPWYDGGMSLFDRLAGLVVPAAQAHEKWFVPVDPVTAPVPDFFVTANGWTYGAVAAVAALTVVGWFVDRWYEKLPAYGRYEKKIRPLRDYAAGVLAVSTAVTLLVMSYRGALLAPNFVLPHGAAATVLLGCQSAIGVLLLIGLFTQAAAMGVIALFLATFALFPWIDALDYLHYLGIGVYLLAFSRGRFSMDWFLGKPIVSTAEQRKKAYVALRIITGITVFWLGLLKWRRPDLHFSLMDKFPNFNPFVILGWTGAELSRELYVFLLVVIEATIGLFEAFGFLTRLSAVLLAPVFMGSVIFLGASELVGHLPILGILFVLFAYGDTYYKGRDPEKRAH